MIKWNKKTDESEPKYICCIIEQGNIGEMQKRLNELTKDVAKNKTKLKEYGLQKAFLNLASDTTSEYLANKKIPLSYAWETELHQRGPSLDYCLGSDTPYPPLERLRFKVQKVELGVLGSDILAPNEEDSGRILAYLKIYSGTKEKSVERFLKFELLGEGFYSYAPVNLVLAHEEDQFCLNRNEPVPNEEDTKDCPPSDNFIVD